MATNKYQIKEFTPTANQTGMGHSVFADAVVDNVITNKELAKKIANRGTSASITSDEGGEQANTNTGGGSNEGNGDENGGENNGGGGIE